MSIDAGMWQMWGLEINLCLMVQQMHITVSVYYTSYDWSNGKERVSLELSFCSLLLFPAYSAPGPIRRPQESDPGCRELYKS